jgi:L-aspartate oxidase
MRPIPPEQILHRFPNIIKVCQYWGIDVFQELVPVSPAAHYWMGGILTDTTNRTNIPGLYAIGETASTGVHGANRLASNSLLECIVFGAQIAEVKHEVERIKIETSLAQVLSNPVFFSLSTSEWENQQTSVESIRQKLPHLVWQSAGICREESVLKSAISTVESWQKDFAALPLSQFLLGLQPQQSVRFNLPTIEEHLRLWSETHNLLDIAYLILRSAIFRTESRGGHYRSDYPQSLPEWEAHTLVQEYRWWKCDINNKKI